MTNMTNAEAVEEKIDKLKSNIANYCKECFKEGYKQGQANEEYFDDGLDGDIYFAINDIFSDACAALTTKPLKDEFPNWQEFNRTGIYVIKRGRFHCVLDFTFNSNNEIIIIAEVRIDGSNMALTYNKVFAPSEAGYNAGIAQLNAWLDELIAELRGM